MLIYIVSSGRSGTSFIGDVLKNLGVSTCHERRGKILRLLSKGWGYRLLKHELKRVTAHPGHLQVEINNMTADFIENIYEDFPRTLFLHLVRDPRDWIRSVINWRKSNPLRRLLTISSFSKFFEANILNWVDENKKYSDLAEKTNKYFLLRYEDLRKDSLAFIKNILNLCGISEDEEKIKKAIVLSPYNKSKDFIGPWQSWGKSYIDFLYLHCKELMRKYGYDL